VAKLVALYTKYHVPLEGFIQQQHGHITYTGAPCRAISIPHCWLL